MKTEGIGAIVADDASGPSAHISIVAIPMLNGEVIRLDGAIRMAPR